VFEYAGTVDSGFDGALQVGLVDMMAALRAG